MEDKDPLEPSAGLLKDIAECLSTLGQPAFLPPLLRLIRTLSISQIMVFSYREGHAQCLLSRNFLEGHTGKRLAADYLDGWFLQDPLYARALKLPDDGFELHQLRDISPKVSDEYRQHLFTDAGISDKITVLTAGKHRLAISFYWQEETQAAPGLLDIAARLVQRHFDALAPSAEPPALQVLSDRERAVCLGILTGKKAELIGHELGIKPTSVATYRQRAYEKLGINSRGELFAICRD